MKNYKEVLHLMKLHISDLTFVSNNLLGKNLAQQMFFFSQAFSDGRSKHYFTFIHFHFCLLTFKVSRTKISRGRTIVKGERRIIVFTNELSYLQSSQMLVGPLN